MSLEDRRRAWRQALQPLIDDKASGSIVDQRSELLREHGLIDVPWYREQAGLRTDRADDVLQHYVEVGHHEGLSPHPEIDVAEIRQRIDCGPAEPVGLLLSLQDDPRFSAIRQQLQCDGRGGKPHRADLNWRDLVDRQIGQQNTFVLYRIIGNDLPPRHQAGQSERNLRFLLENEPHLAGCEKRFVVNRIVAQEVEERILGLLEAHGVPYLHLPFRREEYREVGWRVSDFDRPGMLYGRRHEHLLEESQLRAIDHSLHDKNLYVMNNNGARNAALKDGRRRARWILPFDGNCFFTQGAWSEFVDEISSDPHWRYVLVPMLRSNSNETLIRGETLPRPVDEPQIGFRADSQQVFDEDRRYGRRPKVELLQRLGVPGPWDHWPNESWEAAPAMCQDAGEFRYVAWVARLASGKPKLEADGRRRMISRMEAIRTMIAQVDEPTLLRQAEPRHPLWPPFAGLPHDHSCSAEAQSEASDLAAGFARSEGNTKLDDRDLARRTIALTITGEVLGDRALVHQAIGATEALAMGTGPLGVSDWLLATLLDAIRWLDHGGEQASEARNALTRRIEATLDRLEHSADARWLQRSLGADGTWLEIERLSCAHFLSCSDRFLDASRRLAGRYHDQFALLDRSTQHQRAARDPRNLLAWDLLTGLYRMKGMRLVDVGSSAPKRHAELLMLAIGPGSERAPYPLIRRLYEVRNDADAPGSSALGDALGDEGSWPLFWWLGAHANPAEGPHAPPGCP